MSSRKIGLISLLFSCLFNFSCSFSNIENGIINFELPGHRTAATEDPITYNINLTNKHDRVLYNKTTTTPNVHIANIPAGAYILTIKGHDSVYTYFGKTDVEVHPGKDTDVIITLKKSKIDDENNAKPLDPLEDKSFISFKAILKKDAYVPFGKTIDVTRFTIKETYETEEGPKERTIKTNKEYSNYSVTPDEIITELKDIEVTITHKPSKTEVKAKIPCKFDLSFPTIKFTDNRPGETSIADKITVTQNADKKIKANISYNKDMPDGSYTESYNWYKWNPDKEKYEIVLENNASFTIPSGTKGKFLYKCEIIVSPKDLNYCLSSSISNNKTIEVTVN